MAKWPYNTLHWRTVRPRVMLRDGGLCQLKLPGCTIYATAVHHLLAPPAGHPFAADNLAASCRSCNTAERNMRRAEWARIYAGEQDEPTDVEQVRPW